jgi:hypothetical protein
MSRLVFGVDVAPDGPPVPMAYVGRASCGHIRAVLVDDYRQATVQEAVSWAWEGLEVEHIPVEQANHEIGGCDVCRPAEQEGLGLA